MAVSTGSPWRDLPLEYGPWSTVYDRFRSWAATGVFEDLMQAMIAEAAARGQAGLDLAGVDSTTVRAHHHAAGSAKRSNGCVDLRTLVEVGPYDYHQVPSAQRLWIWTTDLDRARRDLPITH